MRRLKNSLLAAAFVAACVAPFCVGQDEGGYQLVTPAIARVGTRLACKCGVCNNTVGDCAMLGCGYCAPLRARIAKWQSAGKSDDQIVAMVVKENGLQALSSPPNSGFSLLAWWMPFVAIALGLIAIVLFIRRFRTLPAPAGPDPDAALLDQYHERIEKDLSKLD
ncbi:MAG: cytochrome c-type biogenesis protein CcmH [Bryobacteraceae bacterium]